MGFMHINNLYKDPTVLEFEEVYAMEKIHGTSAHITFMKNSPESTDPNTHTLTFYSGGAKYENFVTMFNRDKLLNLFSALGQDDIIVYGECYGGKMQGMSETYGPELKFVVFDIKMNGNWLDVPLAETLTKYLKLEFVDYVRIPATLEKLNEERDKPSTQAIRNGCGNDKRREGIVIRPIRELVDTSGNRIIAKHKQASFCETRKPREVNKADLEVLREASAIAEEWVTKERLNHIVNTAQALLYNVQGLDQSKTELTIEDTGDIIKIMAEDIYREAKGEIVESPQAKQAIGKRTAKLYKEFLMKKLEDK
jgi:hypothetical protein